MCCLIDQYPVTLCNLVFVWCLLCTFCLYIKYCVVNMYQTLNVNYHVTYHVHFVVRHLQKKGLSPNKV